MVLGCKVGELREENEKRVCVSGGSTYLRSPFFFRGKWVGCGERKRKALVWIAGNINRILASELVGLVEGKSLYESGGHGVPRTRKERPR
jgi:hypothetical protein